MSRTVKLSFLSGNILLVVVIFVTSLAVWVFFYVGSIPLSAPESMVVVGLLALITFAARAIWNKLKHKGR